MDAYEPEQIEDEETAKMITPSIEEMKKTWMAKLEEKNCVFISATNKENIDEFKDVLYAKVKAIFKVRYPYNDFLY